MRAVAQWRLLVLEDGSESDVLAHLLLFSEGRLLNYLLASNLQTEALQLLDRAALIEIQ